MLRGCRESVGVWPGFREGCCPLEHCSKSLELHLVVGIGNLLHIRHCVSTVLFRFMLAIVVVFGGPMESSGCACLSGYIKSGGSLK